jgi:hypothetical protein
MRRAEVENAKSSAPMAGSKVSGIEVKPHTAHGSSALEPNHWENYREFSAIVRDAM